MVRHYPAQRRRDVLTDDTAGRVFALPQPQPWREEDRGIVAVVATAAVVAGERAQRSERKGGRRGVVLVQHYVNRLQQRTQRCILRRRPSGFAVQLKRAQSVG